MTISALNCDLITDDRRASKQHKCADCPALISRGNRCLPCKATHTETMARAGYLRRKQNRQMERSVT